MSKLLTLLRLVAAVPLLGIGIQHLTGSAPILPIIEGAGMPFPELSAQAAPIAEVVAGAMLLLGIFPRLGGLIACGSMAGAIYAHLNHDWEDEPSIVIPIAVLVCSLLVIVAGPGAFAVHSGKKDSE